MRNMKIIMLDMSTGKELYSVDNCILSDGEQIVDIMGRFSVKKYKLNERLWELDAFKEYDYNLPINLDFSTTLKKAINEQRHDVINMCFDQCREENNYSSMFIARLVANITSNVSYYSTVGDFHIVQPKDIDFVVDQILKGFDNGIFNENSEYNIGFKEICLYYKNNITNKQDITMIFESEDYNLFSELKNLGLIEIKNILMSEEFHNFVSNYEVDDGDIFSADDYLDSFIRNNDSKSNLISRKTLVNFIIEEKLTLNILSQDNIKSR